MVGVESNVEAGVFDDVVENEKEGTMRGEAGRGCIPEKNAVGEREEAGVSSEEASVVISDASEELKLSKLLTPKSLLLKLELE